MLTADTITDEQINKVWSTTTDPQIADCCRSALGRGGDIWSVRQCAREAVAEYLNANHVTRIETETRGQPVGNTEHHLYHRWVCSCGASGLWGHSLWAKHSIKSCEQSAQVHVANASSKEAK